MKVVITAATAMEWQQIQSMLQYINNQKNQSISVAFHTSGIGVMATAYSITQLLLAEKPDLLIQVGIAGAFKNELKLGEVLVVEEDSQGDLVVEENDELLDVFDLKLKDENEFPFNRKKLNNPWIDEYAAGLKRAASVTISEITTSDQRAMQLQNKYGAAIETMEGAALHYVCLQQAVPFLQIRAISNRVGERDKSNWKLKESLDNLSIVVVQLVEALVEKNNFIS